VTVTVVVELIDDSASVVPISSLIMMVPGARVALLKKIVSTNLDGFVLPEEAWRISA